MVFSQARGRQRLVDRIEEDGRGQGPRRPHAEISPSILDDSTAHSQTSDEDETLFDSLSSLGSLVSMSLGRT